MNQSTRIEILTLKRVIFIFLVLVLFGTTGILTHMPQFSTEIYSYCVGQDGTLYLGKNSTVEAYLDNVHVGNFMPPTTRGYTFNIEPDGTFQFYTGDSVISVNKDFAVLGEKQEDVDLEDKPSSILKPVSGADGDIYRWKNTLGYQQIYRMSDQKLVYADRVGPYLLAVLFFISVVMFIIGGVFMLVKSMQLRSKMEPKNMWSYYDW